MPLVGFERISILAKAYLFKLPRKVYGFCAEGALEVFRQESARNYEALEHSAPA